MDFEKKLQEIIDSYGDWWNKGYETPKMTNDLYPYKKMFEPITINKLKLKNRLVMAPIGNISMSEETGRPNDKMLAYFEERAKGGVGLITTGLVPISFGIDHTLKESGNLSYFPRIDKSRTVFAGWRDLAHRCHAHGAAIFVQLTPGLGRVGNPECLATRMKFPVSASFNPNFYLPPVPCLRLSDGKCRQIIKKMGQGAVNAKAATIDGVYLHGHEGYLLEQMTNTAFNRRKMGRYKDWQRFGIDMVKEIRHRLGQHYPIMYRIDLSLALNATYKEKMDEVWSLRKFKNERTISQTLDYMRNLVTAGVDMFDVDLGCYDNWWLCHPPASMPAGCYIEIAEIVKKFFKENNILSNQGQEVPIVAVGKLGYPDLAEKVLRDNKADMIMLGRPLLADADWCNKAYTGNVESICPCIGCQEACINEFIEGGHPQCAVNPRTAFEDELKVDIAPALIKKRVAVIGAGVAGIVASETLLKRGHTVDLYESSSKIGGSIIPGSVPKIKFDFENYLDYLKNILKRLQNGENFRLFMNSNINSVDLKEKGYDVIVTATGSQQVRPPVKNIEDKKVVFATDVLKNSDIIKDKQNITVIGGGVVGMETAYTLKYEYNKNVKVFEMMPHMMYGACTANRGHLLRYAERAGIELYNCSKLLEVTESGIKVSQNMHKNVPNPYNSWSPIIPESINNPLAFLTAIKDKYEEIDFNSDLIVLACGVKPDDKLYYDCVKEQVAKEIYNIGDSQRPLRVFEAVRAAYRKSLAI